MTKMEFHKDKNFFSDWLMFHDMTTGEIVLWHTLMNIGNRLRQRSIFNAPTSTLMRLTGLSKQGVIDARRKLSERGFIRYQKGSRNKAPIYEMISLHKEMERYYSLDVGENMNEDMAIHKKRKREEEARGQSIPYLKYTRKI